MPKTLLPLVALLLLAGCGSSGNPAAACRAYDTAMGHFLGVYGYFEHSTEAGAAAVTAAANRLAPGEVTAAAAQASGDLRQRMTSTAGVLARIKSSMTSGHAGEFGAELDDLRGDQRSVAASCQQAGVTLVNNQF